MRHKTNLQRHPVMILAWSLDAGSPEAADGLLTKINRSGLCFVFFRLAEVSGFAVMCSLVRATPFQPPNKITRSTCIYIHRNTSVWHFTAATSKSENLRSTHTWDLLSQYLRGIALGSCSPVKWIGEKRHGLR